MNDDWRSYVLPAMGYLAVVALMLGLIAGVVGYLNRDTPQAPVIAPVAPEVRSVPKVDIKPPSVSVYAAPAKAKLAKAGAIPADVAARPSASVIAASRVAASERPTTVTTVIDAETGKSETYVAPAPLPWIAVENRGSVSIDYGYKRPRIGYVSAPVVRLSVRQDVLQFKGLHVGVTASAYSDGDYFVGAGISYRW